MISFKDVLKGGAAVLGGAAQSALKGGTTSTPSGAPTTGFETNTAAPQAVGRDPIVNNRAGTDADKSVKEPILETAEFKFTKIKGGNIVKALDNIHSNIINYLNTVNRNTTATYNYVRDVVKKQDARINLMTKDITDLRKHAKDVDSRLYKVEYRVRNLEARGRTSPFPETPQGMSISSGNNPMGISPFAVGAGVGAAAAAVGGSLLSGAGSVVPLASLAWLKWQKKVDAAGGSEAYHKQQSAKWDEYYKNDPEQAAKMRGMGHGGRQLHSLSILSQEFGEKVDRGAAFVGKSLMKTPLLAPLHYGSKALGWMMGSAKADEAKNGDARATPEKIDVDTSDFIIEAKNDVKITAGRDMLLKARKISLEADQIEIDGKSVNIKGQTQQGQGGDGGGPIGGGLSRGGGSPNIRGGAGASLLGGSGMSINDIRRSVGLASGTTESFGGGAGATFVAPSGGGGGGLLDSLGGMIGKMDMSQLGGMLGGGGGGLSSMLGGLTGGGAATPASAPPPTSSVPAYRGGGGDYGGAGATATIPSVLTTPSSTSKAPPTPSVPGTPGAQASYTNVNDYLWSKYAQTEWSHKDVKAAEKLGMSVKDYVIGGIHPDLRESLYHAGKAADKMGVNIPITSGFRDDYRQSIATGYKARTGYSQHGGSKVTEGYGGGKAVDVSGGAAQSWIDKYGGKYGLHRPIAGADPPHVQMTGQAPAIAARLRAQRLAEEGGGTPVQPQSQTAPTPTGTGRPTMLALRGVGGAIDEASVRAYAERRGYDAHILPGAADVKAARKYIQNNPNVTALYGYSRGANLIPEVAEGLSQIKDATAVGSTESAGYNRERLAGPYALTYEADHAKGQQKLAGAPGDRPAGAPPPVAYQAPLHATSPSGPIGNGPPSSQPNHTYTLANQRAPYAAQIAQNPTLQNDIMAIMASEQNSPAGRMAVYETMLNRGNAQGKSDAMTLLGARTYGKAYYAPFYDGAYARNLPKVQGDSNFRAMLANEMAQVHAGSNYSKFGTHNASAGVAASAARSQTVTEKIGGESYSRKDRLEFGNIHGPGTVRKEKAWYEGTIAGTRGFPGGGPPPPGAPSSAPPPGAQRTGAPPPGGKPWPQVGPTQWGSPNIAETLDKYKQRQELRDSTAAAPHAAPIAGPGQQQQITGYKYGLKPGTQYAEYMLGQKAIPNNIPFIGDKRKEAETKFMASLNSIDPALAEKFQSSKALAGLRANGIFNMPAALEELQLTPDQHKKLMADPVASANLTASPIMGPVGQTQTPTTPQPTTNEGRKAYDPDTPYDYGLQDKDRANQKFRYGNARYQDPHHLGLQFNPEELKQVMAARTGAQTGVDRQYGEQGMDYNKPGGQLWINRQIEAAKKQGVPLEFDNTDALKKEQVERLYATAQAAGVPVLLKNPTAEDIKKYGKYAAGAVFEHGQMSPAAYDNARKAAGMPELPATFVRMKGQDDIDKTVKEANNIPGTSVQLGDAATKEAEYQNMKRIGGKAGTASEASTQNAPEPTQPTAKPGKDTELMPQTLWNYYGGVPSATGGETPGTIIDKRDPDAIKKYDPNQETGTVLGNIGRGIIGKEPLPTDPNYLSNVGKAMIGQDGTTNNEPIIKPPETGSFWGNVGRAIIGQPPLPTTPDATAVTIPEVVVDSPPTITAEAPPDATQVAASAAVSSVPIESQNIPDARSMEDKLGAGSMQESIDKISPDAQPPQDTENVDPRQGAVDPGVPPGPAQPEVQLQPPIHNPEGERAKPGDGGYGTGRRDPDGLGLCTL